MELRCAQCRRIALPLVFPAIASPMSNVLGVLLPPAGQECKRKTQENHCTYLPIFAFLYRGITLLTTYSHFLFSSHHHKHNLSLPSSSYASRLSMHTFTNTRAKKKKHTHIILQLLNVENVCASMSSRGRQRPPK